jgi:hypothetical protein
MCRFIACRVPEFGLFLTWGDRQGAAVGVRVGLLGLLARCGLTLPPRSAGPAPDPAPRPGDGS